jgi:hypothetical protein
MPVEVREAKAASTSTGSTDRVYPSIEAAIDDFITNTSPTSVDQIDTVRIGRNRVSIQIVYTA